MTLGHLSGYPMNVDADPGSLDTVDPDEWDRWEHVVGNCETRAEAIDAALRLRGFGDV